jgi:hypothetical protein
VKVLVCGGRTFGNRRLLMDTLIAIHQRTPISLIIHGGATGADTLADQWADFMGIAKEAVPADWSQGTKAGPMRNAEMIAMKPNLVVGFVGGRGTANCLRQARAAGLEVVEAKE